MVITGFFILFFNSFDFNFNSIYSFRFFWGGFFFYYHRFYCRRRPSSPFYFLFEYAIPPKPTVTQSPTVAQQRHLLCDKQMGVIVPCIDRYGWPYQVRTSILRSKLMSLHRPGPTGPWKKTLGTNNKRRGATLLTMELIEGVLQHSRARQIVDRVSQHAEARICMLGAKMDELAKSRHAIEFCWATQFSFWYIFVGSESVR